MKTGKIIGVDLGGTNVRAGLIVNQELKHLSALKINANGSVEEVVNQIFKAIDELDIREVDGIGIGVPSVIDTEKGIVYDVQNIPSWKEVPIKSILEDKYGVPVLVNNDANCMALGEKYFGKGRGHDNMIGLIIGTGVAGGIIINGRLYEGANCGAGEFGMVRYLDRCFEYYSGGQFFRNVHNISGEEVYRKAVEGDQQALAIFSELGTHLGHVIETILYTYDPDLIVLGGSVGKIYPLYKESLWKALSTFAFSPTTQKLKIELSDLDHPGVVGAAALHYQP